MLQPFWSALLAAAACATAAPALFAMSDLPPGYEDLLVLDGLDAPAGLTFAPDGRLFVCERIQGRLRVALPGSEPGSYQWTDEPFAVFDVPHDGKGEPQRFRSSGLRSVAFDPDFASNRVLYAFYMAHEPRHNRVVRMRQSASEPHRMEPGSEELLLSLPFAAAGSSGSHNGGALAVGGDGCLYVTTGDGWSGGDTVQSLETFTGKVLRLNTDGSIPVDNPFFEQTQGDYRAIYALGLRNPYSMRLHPVRQQLYIGDVGGPNKADVYRLAAGANFGHDGYGGLGQETGPWIDAASMGGRIISGGAWYFAPGPFPADWQGSYLATLWGGNGSSSGDIVRVVDEQGSAIEEFATSVSGTDAQGQALKPVQATLGPDGLLYYLLTTYETGGGQVRVVRPTGEPQAETPSIDPPGGSFPEAVEVELTSVTTGATITYSLDGSAPQIDSEPYVGPISVAVSGVLHARAFHPRFAPSDIASAVFRIAGGPNQAPIAAAGPDQEVQAGTRVVLNGGASSDPDGSAAELGYRWEQVSGPAGQLLDAESAAASFLPAAMGRYEFTLTVSDAEASHSDRMSVEVVPCVYDFLVGLGGRWALDEGEGEVLLDSATGLWNGASSGVGWSPRSPFDTGGSAAFDGSASRAWVEGFDGHPGGQGNLSLSLWMRAEDFSVPDGRLISKASGTAEQDHVYMLSTWESGGELLVRFRLRTERGTSTLIAPGSDLEAGRWIHIAAVYDGVSMSVYQDGQLVGSQAKQGALQREPGIALGIGNQPPGAGERPFHGLLDEVRVYAWALTPEQVSILATRQRHEGCESGFQSF